jgi:hypothetical protein
MRHVFSALLVALVLISGCSPSPIAPLMPAPAVLGPGVPTDLFLRPNHVFVDAYGSDVTVVIHVTVKDGTASAGVPVDLMIRGDETGRVRTFRLLTFEGGDVNPVYHITEQSTFIARAGGLERRFTVLRAPVIED